MQPTGELCWLLLPHQADSHHKQTTDNKKKMDVSSQILIPGGKLVAKKIDPNDPELKAMIKRVNAAQQASLDLKKIDYERLRSTYITI
jgi:hypothetical protein